MSDAKHTPGPWACHLGDDDAKCSCQYVLAEYGGMGSIATIDVCKEMQGPWGDDNGPSVEVAKANARLIAAAPDLLALCELVHGSFGGGRVVTFSDDDIAAFSAAIAKAKGQALTRAEPRASMAEQFEAEMSSAADRKKAAEAKGQP